MSSEAVRDVIFAALTPQSPLNPGRNFFRSADKIAALAGITVPELTLFVATHMADHILISYPKKPKKDRPTYYLALHAVLQEAKSHRETAANLVRGIGPASLPQLPAPGEEEVLEDPAEGGDDVQVMEA